MLSAATALGCLQPALHYLAFSPGLLAISPVLLIFSTVLLTFSAQLIVNVQCLRFLTHTQQLHAVPEHDMGNAS